MPRQKRPLAERLHSIFVLAYGLRTQDFSHDSLERTMAALNEARRPLAPMVGEVLWMSAPIAFTLPGPYVYVTRRLIEYCSSDAPVAFAAAHEIAHHDLGHLDRTERWMASSLAYAP